MTSVAAVLGNFSEQPLREAGRKIVLRPLEEPLPL